MVFCRTIITLNKSKCRLLLIDSLNIFHLVLYKECGLKWVNDRKDSKIFSHIKIYQLYNLTKFISIFKCQSMMLPDRKLGCFWKGSFCLHNQVSKTHVKIKVIHQIYREWRMIAPFSKFDGKIWVGFSLNTGKHFKTPIEKAESSKKL